MPELRDVLRSAAPVPASELDLGRVRRRAAQRRRRGVLVVGGSLLVLATVAASAIVAVIRDDDSRRVRTVDQPGVPTGRTVTSIDALGVRGVAVSGDSLWAAREQQVSEGGTVRPSWVLERRDTSTGDVAATIPMPGVVRGVVASGDVVAAFGGGDGAYPQGGVAIVDARRNHVIATYGWDAGPAVSPYRAAATGDAIWVTDATGHLLKFSTNRNGNPMEVTWDLDGQPTDIVALSDGSIWVWRSQKQLLSRVDPERGIVTNSYSWCCGLFAADGDQIWTSDGDRLIELNPELLAEGLSVAEGARLPVHATAVVPDHDGLWVAAEDNAVQRWSRHDFTASQPQPSAAIDTDTDLAPWALAAHDGAAWFVTNRGLARWRPADTALAPTTTSTFDQQTSALESVDWAKVRYPFDCGETLQGAVGWRVWDVAYAKPASGAEMALVLVTCNAGAGTPPIALLVYDRADSATSAHLAQTLVRTDDNWQANHVVDDAGAVSIPVHGFSSAEIPRCCPDLSATLTWRWNGNSYQPTNAEPAHYGG